VLSSERTMLFGVLSLGKSDALDGECIETNFVVIGLPLLPVGSRYCTWQSGFRSQGFPIRFQWKSAVFAYLRWWTSLLPLVALFDVLLFGMDASTKVTTRALHWVCALSVVGFWVLVCFFGSGPNALARKRRRVLGYATGIRIWPEVQKPETLASFVAQLDSDWWRRGLPDWRSVPPVQGDALLLLYARLRYAHVLEPVAGWDAARDSVWRAIDIDWARVEPVIARAAALGGQRKNV
jgi:hypothetical protein